eukprot:Gregarina_sp_Poly_1__7452@NODE_4146_length_716_cov_54_748844_g2723_i0_p1_GENE_NODE_4146_length_716_cov_54_748844_g2723_i0NODE_4146_length_716_cov_54_748844_g2723_i0_p1_ORF_typecomplete_len106_score8_32_NODE_4146_length_716_cov_54_748844_g2723_i0130447
MCWMMLNAEMVLNSGSGSLVLKLLGRIARATVNTPSNGIIDTRSLMIVVGTKSGIVTCLCPFTGQPVCGFGFHVASPVHPGNLGGHAEGITSLQWIESPMKERIL